MEELLQAIIYSKVWVDQFNRVNYQAAFKKYKENFAGNFIKAAKEYCGIDALALSFVNAIEKSWEEEKFWNRKSVKIDEKMVLTVFLSPMLLSLDDELYKNLANEINKVWNKRFPKDMYVVASYDEIAAGFTDSIFGIKR